MREKFISDSKALLIGQVAEAAFGMFSMIFLARMLGPENRGLLALIILMPMLLKTLLAGGFAASIIYSVSSRKWEEEAVLPKLIAIWLSLSAIMVVVGSLSIGGYIWFTDAVSWKYFALIISIAPLTFGAECIAAVLNGKRRFADLAISGIIVGVLSLIACVVLVWGFDLGVVGALMAQVLAAILRIGVGAYYVMRSLGSRHGKRFWVPRFDLGEECRYGIKSQVANMAAFLNYKADQLLVMHYVGKTGLGVYSVAVNFAEKLWFVTNFIPRIVLPATAESSDGDKEKVGRFVAKLGRVTLLCLCIVGVGLGLLSESLFLLLFGVEYQGSAIVLVYLLPGIVAFGYSRILANFIAGVGRPGLNAMRSIAALVVNIVLNILWLPEYGVKGAALATSVSYSLSAIACWVFFTKLSGVSLRDAIIPRVEDFKEMFQLVKKRVA